MGSGVVQGSPFQGKVRCITGLEAVHFREGEGVTLGTEATLRHLEHGKNDVGEKIHCRAEEFQFKGERIAGLEHWRRGSRVEDDGSGSGVQSSQEARGFALNEGFEESGEGALAFEHTFAAQDFGAHGANGFFEGMAKGAPEHGAFKFGEPGFGFGL